MSRSWSSLTDPSSPQSSAPGPCRLLATAPSCSWSSRPRAERRRLSIARFRAVVTIHPAGLGGIPSLCHRSFATTNASWTASSASVRSPKRRTSVATAWPYTSRNTLSTPGASRWAATIGVTPSGARHLEKWPDFDRLVDALHDLAGPSQRRVKVVGVDDVEPADVLLRLNERPVGDGQVAIALADNGSRVRAMESAPEDERSTRLHLSFEGSYPLHEFLHLLGRLRLLVGLPLCGVNGQKVLTHDCLLGLVRAIPALTPSTNGISLRGHPKARI